ncbi:unnamed protein product [Coregonus sp. 'balchen']|nr:unnamed protein product [Coregonus sp. 'balchen']
MANQVPLDLLEKLDYRGDQETLDLRDFMDELDLKEARVNLVYKGSQVLMGISASKDLRVLLERLAILDRLDLMEILDQRVTKEEMGSTILDKEEKRESEGIKDIQALWEAEGTVAAKEKLGRKDQMVNRGIQVNREWMGGEEPEEDLGLLVILDQRETLAFL